MAVKFWRQAVIRILVVTTLAEAVKPKYGANVSALSGFTLISGNVNADSDPGGNCGA